MTSEEIVKALRYCSTQDCIDCAAGKYFGYGDCLERLVACAADLIERLTAENAALEMNRKANKQMNDAVKGQRRPRLYAEK